MISTTNRVRAKLDGGGPVRGVVTRTFAPAAVEMIGLAGFDYVWIDLEHGNAGFDTAEAMVRAADSVAIESMIRIPDRSPSSVLRALETGASIVCAPQVDTAAEAQAVAHAARFHPRGGRGYTTASRGTGYGFTAPDQALLDSCNERVMVVVQIESEAGLRNVNDIARVPGVDVLFAGLGDLSQQFGRPGAYDDPMVVEAGRAVAAAARAAGKHAGINASNAAAVRAWSAQGVRFFFCGVDVVLLGQALRSLRAQCETP